MNYKTPPEDEQEPTPPDAVPPLPDPRRRRAERAPENFNLETPEDIGLAREREDLYWAVTQREAREHEADHLPERQRADLRDRKALLVLSGLALCALIAGLIFNPAWVAAGAVPLSGLASLTAYRYYQRRGGEQD